MQKCSGKGRVRRKRRRKGRREEEREYLCSCMAFFFCLCLLYGAHCVFACGCVVCGAQWSFSGDVQYYKNHTWRQVERRTTAKVARDCLGGGQAKVHEFDSVSKHDDVFGLNYWRECTPKKYRIESKERIRPCIHDLNQSRNKDHI